MLSIKKLLTKLINDFGGEPAIASTVSYPLQGYGTDLRFGRLGVRMNIDGTCCVIYTLMQNEAYPNQPVILAEVFGQVTIPFANGTRALTGSSSIYYAYIDDTDVSTEIYDALLTIPKMTKYPMLEAFLRRGISGICSVVFASYTYTNSDFTISCRAYINDSSSLRAYCYHHASNSDNAHSNRTTFFYGLSLYEFGSSQLY